MASSPAIGLTAVALIRVDPQRLSKWEDRSSGAELLVTITRLSSAAGKSWREHGLGWQRVRSPVPDDSRAAS